MRFRSSRLRNGADQIQATREAEAAARIEAAMESRSNTLPRGSSKPIGRPGRMLSPLRILKLDLLRTRYGRLFHRSAASVTVGAVGPNAEHFLHKTNFGSRSPLIQSSEEPQKGQGSSRQEDGIPVSAFCPGFSAIWFGPCRAPSAATLLRRQRERRAR